MYTSKFKFGLYHKHIVSSELYPILLEEADSLFDWIMEVEDVSLDRGTMYGLKRLSSVKRQ